ncbi:MAG: PAS domain S-box protein [Bacteroidales bacterium]|nr:PAS domain S-box protein [Bacteroidales bacterium]
MPNKSDKYNFLFESVNFGILIRDEEGYITDLNKAGEEILGYSLETLRNSEPFAEPLKFFSQDHSPVNTNEYPDYEALKKGKTIKNSFVGFIHPKHKRRCWLKVDAIPEIREGEDKPFLVYLVFCDITDQVEYYQHLELYRIAVENSTDAIGMSTPGGKHYYQNKAFDELFGEVGIDPIDSLYVNKDVGREVFHTIMEGNDWNGLVEMYSKNGEILSINLRASSIKDVNEKIIGLVGVHNDITEKLLVESELIESEQKLRMALEGARADSWIINVETQELIFSQQFANYFGYTLEEVPRTIEAVRKLMHPDDIAPNLEALQKHLASELPLYESEVRIKNKDGDYSWIFIRGKITEYSEDGRPTKLIGTSFDITDQKLNREEVLASREKLQQSITKLKAIINALPGMVSVVDKEFNVLVANNEVIRVFGNSNPDEVIGKKCYLTRKGSKFPCEQCGLVKAYETKELVTRVSTPEEEEMMGIATKAYAVPLLDEKGEIRGGVEVILDVTDLRRAEQSLLESEKKFRHMIEHGGECITLIDAKGTVTYESPTAKYMTGFEPEERIGRSSLELIYKEDLPSVMKIMSTVAKSPGESMNAQFRAIRKDGSIYWVYGTATNLLNDPNVKALVVNYRDITRQKEAEEALQKSEERFRRIYEESQIGMAFIRADNRKLEGANPYLCKMLGYTSGEIAKLKLENMILPDQVEYYTEQIKRLVRDEIKHIREEIKFLKKDKSLIWASIVVAAMRNKEGEIEYLLALIKDISDLKNAEAAMREQVMNYQKLNEQYLEKNQELRKSLDKINQINYELKDAKNKAEESDHLKTAFLANMSHEIRTPMNGILGFTDLLRQTNLTDSEFTKYLDIIQKSGHRMLNIINDLIDISKIEAGQVEIDIKPISVNKVLDNFYNFFLPDASRKHIALVVRKDLSDKAAVINTDEIKLSQVLSNLIKNALKYTAEGKIEFGYQLVERELQFYVEDTGTGIDPASRKIIFERFRQGNHGKDAAVEGSGLGLSISKAFLELMGGRIWLESELNKGSVFYFTLPFSPVKEEADTAEEPVEVGFKSKSTTLLLAEDDESSYLYIKEVFRDFNTSIIHVENGKLAIDEVRNNRNIDLVLMDIKMPVMDGLEATQEIKKIRPGLPVIAQTAFASLNDNHRALEAGCDDCITKPIHRKLLLEIINRYLELK